MKKRGFTLIELMVVVVIIGILAAIAIPNFVKVVGRAKEASVKANMKTLQTTVEGMSIDHMGRYPVSGSDDSDIQSELPSNFKNPFTGNAGSPDAWVAGSFNSGEGVVYYEASGTGSYDATAYTIMGGGKGGSDVELTLTPGQ